MNDQEKSLQPGLFDKLVRGAVSTLTPSEEGFEYEVGGRRLTFATGTPAYVCRVFPHFRQNYGFFHLFQGEGECILLKGVYDDNVRIVKKGIGLDKEKLSRIGRFLAEVESAAGGECELWFLSAAETDYAVEVKEHASVERLGADPFIPRPLTHSEYADGRTGNTDTTLFSRGFLHGLFPESISQFAAAVVKGYPDIISSFFLALDAKVGSPSLKHLNLRLYTNMSSLTSAFRETRTDFSAFAAEYMPWQRNLDESKKRKGGLVLSSLMTHEEMAAFIASLDESIASKGHYLFFNKDFFDPLPHLSTMGVMLCLLFQEQLLYLAELLRLSAAQTLDWIYKTREGSFFIRGAALSVPVFFDPACEQKELTFAPSAESAAGEGMLDGLSSFRRWRKGKKMIRVLQMAHHTLDMRDALLRSASSFHKKVREAMLNHGDHLVTRKRFSHRDDIFLFDLNDIRRLVHDTYYSNFPPVLYYKRGFRRRAAAQPMPYEIYEADIPYSGLIAEEQFQKFAEQDVFPCLSRNGAEISGEVLPAGADVPEGSIVVKRAFSLPEIAALKKPAAVITDLAPPFSYISEYCILHQIPLYYGIRHSELLFAGRRVHLLNNEIHRERS